MKIKTIAYPQIIGDIENRGFVFLNSSHYNFLPKITRTDIQLYQIGQNATADVHIKVIHDILKGKIIQTILL